MGAASNYNGARKKWRSNLSRQCSTYSISNPIFGNISFSRGICVGYQQRETYICVFCVRQILSASSAICWSYSQKWPLKAIFVHLNHFLGKTSLPLIIHPNVDVTQCQIILSPQMSGCRDLRNAVTSFLLHILFNISPDAIFGTSNIYNWCFI